jgi:tetratricopeptide (TPR) repeat protein
MKITIDEANRLRREGQEDASRRLLVQLAEFSSADASVQYECACAHDRMGMEREAVAFYEKAISLGLSGTDLAGAYLGLGSTYRNLGEYAKACEILARGCREFPADRALKVFLTMALYNSGEAKSAVSELLKVLVETTSDEGVKSYQHAILLYAEDLDRKFS